MFWAEIVLGSFFPSFPAPSSSEHFASLFPYFIPSIKHNP
ncbi:hypothetical protein SLEP1_g16132 [Rubroshorea leprosula]|uniref:Uncharacterized protein n=1 Tax=Rubroshorea leprosula TaxID=152421 RepID=A0AAV5IVW6_9ROSI|nr:hypothetical protein SLEP1_g16132 [Rubroshorea leprosula]